MIYEVRINKVVSISSCNVTTTTTLIEYITAKNILDALSMAKLLAENLKGSLKAVTADPQLIVVFELIEDSA